MKLKAGEWVEVKSKEEILRTLDQHGQRDHVPCMPQMLKYCGQRFKVYKRAHKTCDTVNPIRSLRVTDAVHLDLRCDGEAYGGCQAGCLIFWKTIVRTRLSFTRGKKMPSLILSEGVVSIDKAAREYFVTTQATEGLLATAIVVKTPFSRFLGNVFMQLNKFPMPVRIFSWQAKGEVWLKQFIQ